MKSQKRKQTAGAALRHKQTSTMTHWIPMSAMSLQVNELEPEEAGALMKEAESHNHAYATHSRMCVHSHLHARPYSCQTALFWTVYLDTGKGQGLVYISLCTKGKLHRPWTWGCVTAQPFFFPPLFNTRLRRSPMFLRKSGHQQESRGTDKELNSDRTCRKRSSLNTDYQMTNGTTFLTEYLWN